MVGAAKWPQSCPTLCDPVDGSPPGSPVPGILQARTLEWVAISFSSAWKWKVKVKLLSPVWLPATAWTAAYQAPPSMGFSRQEYWSGVPLRTERCGIFQNHRGLFSWILTIGIWSRLEANFMVLWGSSLRLHRPGIFHSQSCPHWASGNSAIAVHVFWPWKHFGGFCRESLLQWVVIFRICLSPVLGDSVLPCVPALSVDPRRVVDFFLIPSDFYLLGSSSDLQTLSFRNQKLSSPPCTSWSVIFLLMWRSSFLNRELSCAVLRGKCSHSAGRS